MAKPMDLGAIVLAITARYDAATASGEWPSVPAWAFESDQDRARRWRRAGLSQQRIADRLGCSRWRVRQMLM
ncbi:MAG: hypothetical protein WCQ20_14950 [Synechococcaceae cyanobacterium ELA739]|jgi:hypothetical protein